MSDNAARRLSRMFYRISIAIEAGKDHLSDLDGAIGDADHGIIMSLGFMAVNAELAKLNLDDTLPSEVFAVAASAFLDAVGASTGPLYATAFRRAAQALKKDECLSPADQATIVEAMTTGIKERGKGQRGDKTMLDAWVPATEAAVNARARAAGGRKCGTAYWRPPKSARTRHDRWSPPAAGRHDWESDPWGTWTQAQPRPSSSCAR